MKAPFRRSALYASILATGAQVALAQPQLEEIIVTARKRVESLQDVPISVSAVSGSKMEPVSYTHLRAHETVLDLVCRLLLDKKNRQRQIT